LDPTQVSSIGSFAEKFGFQALLVIVLLVGIWKMLESHKAEREKRDDRDEEREKERRLEREADRTAHVSALAQNTAAVNTLGTAFSKLDDKLDRLHDTLAELRQKTG
jgi:predicted RNase H-like nuclease (RuvC/YqgF family)